MTTKASILSAIRQKCLDCSCHQPSEVRDCRITACDLWPFRLGSDPAPSPNRGFAKPSAYTGDLSSRAGRQHPDTRRDPLFAESPVYTDGFTQGEPSPRRKLVS
jgi:hypothetical protein